MEHAAYPVLRPGSVATCRGRILAVLPAVRPGGCQGVDNLAQPSLLTAGSEQISRFDSSADLSIRELAEFTGVPQATLRSWEARYGLPRPRRLAGGHRRYTADDVALVEDVLRQRADGLSLPAAMARATARTRTPENSVYAGLRRRRPDLEPRVLRKATLLALTRAIEDECCARAARPLLFVGFQSETYYRQSRIRWAELSRTAESVVVFADFPGPPTANGNLLDVPLPPDAPLRREWFVVCDAADHPACVAGWEQPGTGGIADADRRFETLWTVDPQAVRDAACIAAELAETLAPSHGLSLAHALEGTPPPPSADLRRAASLLNRMVGYLEASR